MVAKPTIKEVAERAGVSKSLVSLAMRGSPKVSIARKKAIFKAATELGYRPNAMARGLVEGRTRVIGVIVYDLHYSHYAEVIDGIDSHAAQQNYRILISTRNRLASRKAESIETFLELRMDGLIVTDFLLPEASIIEASRWAPVVVTSRNLASSQVDSIATDDRAGIALAVDHLAALGHRHIAYIDGGQSAAAKERREGYCQTMVRLGLEQYVTVIPGDFSEEGGYRAMKTLLEAAPGVTGVCAVNDLSALGAIDAITEQKLKVPDDISVVGYDNTALAALRSVNLTTISQPLRQIGEMASQFLLERIEGERSTPRHVKLAPSLVVRGTSGPPPGPREGRIVEQGSRVLGRP